MVMTLMSNPKGAVGTVVVAADGSGDTTDIQTGIDMLPATGGCVYIKEGTYNVVGIIVNVDNTSIIGCGRSTIINTTAQYGLLIDGLNYCTVENFYISSSNATGSCIYLNNGIMHRVERIWVNCASVQNFGIFVEDSSNCRILNNWVYDFTYTGIELQNDCTQIIITNNHITTSAGAAYGIELYMDITYTAAPCECTISENIIEGMEGIGITTWSDLGNDPPLPECQHNIILGNQIHNITGPAPADGVGISVVGSYNTIANNNIDNVDRKGIELYNTYGGFYNDVVGNNISNAGLYGIWVSSDYCIISSNMCENCAVGIELHKTAAVKETSRNIITSNYCVNNDIGILLRAAVNYSAEENLVSNNYFVNNTTVNIEDRGVFYGYLRNQIFDNIEL